MSEEDVAAVLFAGSGEMRTLSRKLDWAATPLGPVSQWSQSLRTLADAVLASRQPMLLFWGPELVQIYNDAFRPSLDASTGSVARHPRALGMRAADFWNDVWHVIGPQIGGVMTHGEPVWHEELYLPIESGEGVLRDAWWNYSYSPVRDDDGSIGGTLVVCTEITEHVLTERLHQTLMRELTLERARLVDVFQQAPAFIAVLRGPAHVFELANDYYYQVVGYRDVLHRPLIEAIPEVQGQGFLELLDAVLLTGEPFVGRELPIMLARTPGASPEQRFLTFAYQPLREVDGTCSGIFVHGVDVTDEVRSRQAVEALNGQLQEKAAAFEAQAKELKASTADLEERTAEAEMALDALSEIEARLRATYDGTFEYIGIIAPDGTVIDCNRASLEFAGNTREHVVGKAFWETPWFEHTAGASEMVHDGVKRAAAGEFVRKQIALTRPSGEVITFDFSLYPIRDANGHVIFIVPEGRDITDRVRVEAERELLLADAQAARAEAEDARGAAEAANRIKGDFLAAMSHELRTPLNAIAGYAQLIEIGVHGPVTEAQRIALARIQRNEQHLLNLVNDVLNFAKLEAGQVTYEMTELDLADAVAAANPMIEPQLAAKGLSYDVRIAPDILVRADGEKLQQIVLNLLSNAVKFTPWGGRISVDTGHRGERPESTREEDATSATAGVVFLRVSDSGIGIPRDKQDSIFDPFVQVENGLTRSTEGTGLGLAISRDLARAMGGDLRVRSTPGVGSTLTLMLRRA